jgi:ribosomal protein S18 acetylase RimI-like enzyme
MNADRIDVFLSLADTRRFGVRVCRCRVDHCATTLLADAIRRSEADIAIVRSEAGTSPFVGDLARSGFQVVHAGVLVYYRTILQKAYGVAPRHSAVSVDVATPEDAVAIELIAEQAFYGFRSHYCASPIFRPADVLAGYREWARNCALDGQHVVLVAKTEQGIVGFLAYRPDPDNGGAEIVLNAVIPSLFNQGIYTELIRSAMHRLARDGCSDLRVSTQVHNYAVQKVWAREGFRLYLALDTFHVTRAG